MTPCDGCPGWQDGRCVAGAYPAPDGRCSLRDAVDAELAAEEAPDGE